MSDVDRDELAASLGSPGAVVVEAEDGEPPAGDWAAVVVPADGFYLSLSTATAFSLQVALLVGAVLAARTALTAEKRSVVELCLQEAMANAVIHGNLGISSTAKDHPEGYRVFSQLVNGRLSDPARRGRRIEVFVRWSSLALDISVVDQGSGFDVARLPPETVSASRSGRGFVFMRALANRVAVTDGGRCTSLRFEL
ncbi:MAG: ATP-binding protein [Rhodospirillaceae bacterium]